MASGSEESSLISNDDFMKIVGLVEDIFVGEDFRTLHIDYCGQHWELFVDGENESDSAELEKKSKERFNAFRKYSVQTAQFLENSLKEDMGNEFEIRGFLQEVESRIQRAETIAARENVPAAESSAPNSPRRTDAGASASVSPRPDIDPDLIGMDGEIFSMLLTLRDYARFQELMVDYAKMMQGKTPNMDDLVSLRKVADDDDD